LLTSKQRAALKSIAANTETILQVGKGGIGDQLVKQVDDALAARELIKLHVLESAPEEPGPWPMPPAARWCRSSAAGWCSTAKTQRSRSSCWTDRECVFRGVGRYVANGTLRGDL